MSDWMIVTSPANFELTRNLGFRLVGMKSRHRRKAERMKPGDRIAFYLTGEAVFMAVCETVSTFFESHERIWHARGKPAEDYPWRIHLRPRIIAGSNGMVPASVLRGALRFVRQWPPEYWRLAFQGNVHALPAEDLDLIESALRERAAVG